MSEQIRRARGYPELFGRAVKSRTSTAEDAQLAIITRKALLGDQEAQRLSEEHGPNVATAHAAHAAHALGKCSCTRTSGVVCGRRVTRKDAVTCWVCWANRKDSKPCRH